LARTWKNLLFGNFYIYLCTTVSLEFCSWFAFLSITPVFTDPASRLPITAENSYPSDQVIPYGWDASSKHSYDDSKRKKYDVEQHSHS
jgi:hypothetical protein